MLVDIIVSAQNGNQADMLSVISKFLPIIRKYGVKLGGEDGKSELTVFLIELIQNFRVETLSNSCDGAITKYFCTCIYREFLRLNTKRQQETYLLLSDGAEMDYFTYHQETLPDGDPIEWYISAGSLTHIEEVVIRSIFEKQYTSAEIARQMDVTRQNINQIKKRALSKIKQGLLGDK